MKRVLMSFLVLITILCSVVTGAVIGVGFYQAGYAQGATDEKACYETEGESCEGEQQDEQLIPA